MKKTLWLLACLLSFSFSVFCQDNTSYDSNAGNAGTKNSSFGYNAGASVTGTENLFMGYGSGRYTTSNNYNAFIGAYSGYQNTTGYLNTYIGASAGYSSTSFTYNTTVGYCAAYSSTASRNVILGSQAKRWESGGERNVILGHASGINSSGSYNIFIGDAAGSNESDSSKLYIENSSSSSPLIYGDFDSDFVTINGKMGVGTSDVPDSISLLVDSLIIAKEVVIRPSSFPDFVFEEDYELMSLPDLEKNIEILGHLPGIVSDEEAINQGIDSGTLSMKLLEKIEELSLYLIDLNNELDMEKGRQQMLVSLLANLQANYSSITAEANQTIKAK